MSKLPPKITRRTKVLGFSKAETAAARKAMEEQGTGTPKAVLDAFFPEAITLSNLTLQPCTGSTILALQKIESSFTKSDNPKDFPAADIARCLLIFIVPIAKVRELLGGTLFTYPGGPKVYRDFDAAVEAMTDKLEPAVLMGFGPVLNEHIAKAFSTAVPYRAKGSGGSDFPQAPESGPASGGS